MAQNRLGRYEIDGEIGRGGMSVVYAGRDPALDRPVALKVLHPHLADRRDSRERFTREAKAVARLRHPHIVEVYDYAPPDSKQAYIVTEYIAGPTLRVFAEEHPIRHSELAALLMVPIFEALGRAHTEGIVHRDVKPENIMIRPNGTPVLMDFGIAQMVNMDTLTATGTMLGSPAHMAPEVVDGADVGSQADIFSAGTVLYWLVCGALPFSGPNPAALFRRILECRFDPVLQRRPQAGRAIARLIDQCLARDPQQRPQGVVEVIKRLRAILDDAGLGNLLKELSAYSQDPEVYQNSLTQRLLPRYVQAAKEAVDAGSTARALDFLDRALSLEEAHPEALAILARIERGQRRSRVLHSAIVAAIVIGISLGGYTLLSLMETDDPLPRSVERATTASSPADTHPPLPLDATIIPDIQVILDAAAPPVDARPDVIVVDARPKLVRRVKRLRPKRIIPKIRLKVPPIEPKLPPKALSVRVASGPFKAAKIYVDDNYRGSIGEIQGRGGLKMFPGAHRISIRNPGCAHKNFVYTIDPTRKSQPDIRFIKCANWLPAMLLVSAKGRHPVMEDGKVIGQTNSLISLDMTHQNRELVLTVGEAGDTVRQTRVLVVAGQRRTAKVDL